MPPSGPLEPALDAEHCREDIRRIEDSLRLEREMLKEARDRKAATAAAQHSGRIDALAKDLTTRQAELRRLNGIEEMADAQSINDELVRVIRGGEWPIPLAESLYLACRDFLRIEEHLPEAPVTQWH